MRTPFNVQYGKVAQQAANSERSHLVEAIAQRSKATGTHGPAPSFAPRMMAKDDLYLHRGSGGLGRSEGLGAPSASGAGLGRDVPRPSAPKSAVNPQGAAPKKEVRIQNDVVDQPRTGSGLKVDAEKTIFDSKTGKVIKEFPTSSKEHGFPDIIDNYAGISEKFVIDVKGIGGAKVRTAELYQLEGGLSGKKGIFEWIVDKGGVTHRRFIESGKITGYPNQTPLKGGL